jgi:hypothetical protein
VCDLRVQKQSFVRVRQVAHCRVGGTRVARRDERFDYTLSVSAAFSTLSEVKVSVERILPVPHAHLLFSRLLSGL